MSYDPYPSGGGGEAPKTVTYAVWLMYAGAAVSAISVIVALTQIGALRSTIKADNPSYSASQVSASADLTIAAIIVGGLIGIGLWIWMARANGQGKNWARVTSSVLFAIETLSVLEAVRGPKTVVALVFPVLTWLVGLGAVWFLWRPESSQFFRAQEFT